METRFRGRFADQLSGIDNCCPRLQSVVPTGVVEKLSAGTLLPEAKATFHEDDAYPIEDISALEKGLKETETGPKRSQLIAVLCDICTEVGTTSPERPDFCAYLAKPFDSPTHIVTTGAQVIGKLAFSLPVLLSIKK